MNQLTVYRNPYDDWTKAQKAGLWVTIAVAGIIAVALWMRFRK